MLYTFTYDHPAYRNLVTVDCFAADAAAALLSARRFLHCQNRRFHDAGVPRVRLPRSADELAFEPPLAAPFVVRPAHRVVAARRSRARLERG